MLDVGEEIRCVRLYRVLQKRMHNKLPHFRLSLSKVVVELNHVTLLLLVQDRLQVGFEREHRLEDKLHLLQGHQSLFAQLKRLERVHTLHAP